MLKYVHIIVASVTPGTGGGIAFFMPLAHRTGNAATIAAVARILVTAGFPFTATMVVAQPITRAALDYVVGYPLTEGCIVLSINLSCIFTGVPWLPVVWIQMELRRLASEDAERRHRCPTSITSCSGCGSRSATRLSQPCWRSSG